MFLKNDCKFGHTQRFSIIVKHTLKYVKEDRHNFFLSKTGTSLDTVNDSVSLPIMY